MSSNTGKRETLEPENTVRQRNRDADSGGQPAYVEGWRRQTKQYKKHSKCKEERRGKKWHQGSVSTLWFFPPNSMHPRRWDLQVTLDLQSTLLILHNTASSDLSLTTASPTRGEMRLPFQLACENKDPMTSVRPSTAPQVLGRLPD